MSKLILFFLFLFLILFTIDKKPMNILLDFIGIVLTLAIYIILNNKIDMSLISYMLIIIYGSAIVILFGFIIMLYHYSKTFKPLSILDQFIQIKSKEIFISLFPKGIKISPWFYLINKVKNIFLIIIYMYLLYVIINNMYIELEDISNFFIPEEKNLDIIKAIFEKIYNSEDTWLILSILINILLLVMLGIIYILA